MKITLDLIANDSWPQCYYNKDVKCGNPVTGALTGSCYCGSLGWTEEKYGRITHKHDCPARPDNFCQAHPDGVGCKPRKRSWHVADMCDCPSCPIRCAIRTALHSAQSQSD